ncbi:hypothetical protein F511_23509 [Dorcoceras hygrometricum]|uniref:Uncharacterized protein n=1 Tax=Dorcoceras hygrometricum TaxID=472368 RepID=A0A2Z7DKH8_9LAMI|nr:hypothetical protein F511_23509 [Dorcoceras hygrometricum]
MSFMAVIPPDSSDRLSIKSQYIAIPERSKGIFAPVEIREINWATHFLPKIDPTAKGKGMLEACSQPNPVEEHCQLVLKTAWEDVSSKMADCDEWCMLNLSRIKSHTLGSAPVQAGFSQCLPRACVVHAATLFIILGRSPLSWFLSWFPSQLVASYFSSLLLPHHKHPTAGILDQVFSFLICFTSSALSHCVLACSLGPFRHLIQTLGKHTFLSLVDLQSSTSEYIPTSLGYNTQFRFSLPKD